MKKTFLLVFIMAAHLGVIAQIKCKITITSTTEEGVKFDPGDILTTHKVAFNENGNEITITNNSLKAINCNFTQKEADFAVFKFSLQPGSSETLSFDAEGTLSNGLILFAGNVGISFALPDKTFFNTIINFTQGDDGGKGGKDIPNRVGTGTPVYDAVTIATILSGNVIDEKEQEDVASILKFYACQEKNCNWVQLKSRYVNNRFIAPVIDSLERKFTNGAREEATGGIPSLVSSALSSVGGLDVTNIADGLAKFLVKRTKQELSIAFFDRLKKVIDENKDLNTLFPQTAALLSIIGDEVYNYQNYIQNLREAFKQDIQDLDKNLPGIINNHQQFFERNKALDVSLRSACYIASELEIKAHPGDILAGYPDEYLNKLGEKNLYKGAIQTLQLLSESLRDTTGENTSYWVNIKQVRDLVINKDAFEIYLGLLVQQAITKYDGIYFDDTNSFADLLNSVGGKKFDSVYTSYKNYVMRFGEKIDAINKMVKEEDEPATDSAKLEKYAKYFRSSVDMIEYCISVCDLPLIDGTRIGSKIGNLHTELKPYFNVAYAVTDLTTDINRRNYSAAINHAVFVYNEIIAKKHPEYSKEVTSLNAMKNDIDKVTVLNKFDSTIMHSLRPKNGEVLADSIKIKFAADTLNKLAIATTSSNNPETALSHLINFGAFMASVATAKNSDDVEAAIESAALPVGSSRIKRASAFNVSLNAYVGLFTGHEWIKGVDDKQTFNIAGVSTPIGIAVSWRLGYGKDDKMKDNTQGNSLSVFASLIDIGAVTTYRFSNMDSVAKLPTIELKDIIAPGIFVSWGIKGLPISLNAGYQLGPLLRDVGSEVNETVDNYYHRVIISANVDLPLLNLYNRKYKLRDLQ